MLSRPGGPGQPAQFEVRQWFEFDDFAPSGEVDRFRELAAAR